MGLIDKILGRKGFEAFLNEEGQLVVKPIGDYQLRQEEPDAIYRGLSRLRQISNKKYRLKVTH